MKFIRSILKGVLLISNLSPTTAMDPDCIRERAIRWEIYENRRNCSLDFEAPPIVNLEVKSSLSISARSYLYRYGRIQTTQGWYRGKYNYTGLRDGLDRLNKEDPNSFRFSQGKYISDIWNSPPLLGADYEVDYSDQIFFFYDKYIDIGENGFFPRYLPTHIRIFLAKEKTKSLLRSS